MNRQVSRPQFLTQRPNFQAPRLSLQMQRPQQQPPRPSVQQPSCQNLQQGPHSNAPTSQGAPTQGSSTSGACFKCGLTGHFAWQCPTRSTAPGAGNQAKSQGQQNFKYGKVNHMTSDEAHVVPRSEKEGTKPPYVCPGCSNHMHGNN
jgi:hypothetical protein